MAQNGGLRDMARTLAHGPYRDVISQMYLWLLGLGPDACLEKLNQGVHAHLIQNAPPDALAILGDERHVRHGLTESDDSYRARVGRAITDYPMAGNAWSILGQVLGYVLAKMPGAMTVKTNYSAAGAPLQSLYDYFAEEADTTSPPQHLEDAGSWDWDSLSPTTGSWGWWRFYLVVQSFQSDGQAWIGKLGKWGAVGKWGSGKAWGVDASKLVGLSIRIIAGQWKPVDAWLHWIVINFDDSIFLPGLPVGSPFLPDGHYGRWSKLVGGVYVRSRLGNAAYFQGP